MNQNFRKRCVVLGGTGHVGAAVCRLLHEHEAQLAFTYCSNRSQAERLAAELPGSHGIHADLTGFEATRWAVREAVEFLGGLDTLIQCAGTAGNPALYHVPADQPHAKFLEITESEWDAMLNLTVRSTFAACQAAAPVMAQAEAGGNIVVVGSIDGVRPLPAPIHYAAGKGAVRSLVEALSKELGSSGIRVNHVAVGILDGGLSQHLSRELMKDYVEHCSLKRVGTAREVAEVVVQLALENTYVTGQTIVLDGGL